MSKLSDGITSAKTTATQTKKVARDQASKAIEAGREAAARGVSNSRDFVNKAAVKTGEGIDNNPLAIVLGGIAIGAIVGALLPRTEQEMKVLGKTGKKLNKKARKMAEAAKDAGKNKIDTLGLSGDAIRDQFRILVSKAADAVKAAGAAASDAAKKSD